MSSLNVVSKNPHHSFKTKGKTEMKTYTIESLLIGKTYQPQSTARKDRGGVISHAEKRGNVWAGENAEAYAVRYLNPDGWDEWATIVVAL